ncbi:MAG: pyruvate kinase [Methanomicrobiales archaeon]|nr:pyruvate kinase [Methanomicrobiales archaeon]
MNNPTCTPDPLNVCTLRRTKIIATIGPASENPRIMREMILSGMDIARLNFSHGSWEWHCETAQHIRIIAGELNREIGIMVDIPGPKLRVLAKSPPREVITGDTILIAAEDHESSGAIKVGPPDCVPYVYPGDMVLVGDGAVTLQVLKPGPLMLTTVTSGGTIKEGMGVVFPGRRPDVPYAGTRFQEYLKQGAALRPDYIALSFVGSAQDILDARSLLMKEGLETLPLIAKIECRRAVDALSSIAEHADGIMVARGDLGVELPIEQVPHIQKHIINICARQGIPVITATEMLESMVHRGRPTRAEVTDVANAIVDGTDATMLSAETSVGKHPGQAVIMMARIAVETEGHLPYLHMLNERSRWHEQNVEGVISYRACFIAEELESPAIVAFTRSGLTAERVSRCRPRAPILALTPDSEIARRLLLRWGVQPVISDPIESADELFTKAVKIAQYTGIAQSKDNLVIIAGNFSGKEGRTNMIKIEEIP